MCASIAVGALATSGSASLLALTTVVPAIWLFQPSRRTAYFSACCYYLAALWQIPGILHSLPAEVRLDLRRSRELTHRCSPEVDQLAQATMNGHARCPEETLPDLPAVVPA